MSYYLNIYECNHQQIEKLLNSGIESNDFELISKDVDVNHKIMLTKLFSRDYSRDPQTWESPDANGLISALEKVCHYAAGGNTVIEFYLDQDRSPEMMTFSFNDWDVADDFGLPVSPDGTPAVIYRDNKSLVEYLKKFKEMLATGNYDDECLSEAYLSKLINIIEKSVENNKGLFVFCWQ